MVRKSKTKATKPSEASSSTAAPAAPAPATTPTASSSTKSLIAAPAANFAPSATTSSPAPKAATSSAPKASAKRDAKKAVTAPAPAVVAPKPTGTSFLGMSQVDPELDSVFSKSAAYAIPIPAPQQFVKPTPKSTSIPTASSSTSTINKNTAISALPPKKRKREDGTEQDGKKPKKEKHAKRKEKAAAAAASSGTAKVIDDEKNGDEDEEMDSIADEAEEDEEGSEADALVDLAIAELEAEADEEAEGEMEDGESENDGEGSDDEESEGSDEDEAEQESDDADVDPSKLVHESLDPNPTKKDKKPREKSKKPEKYVPPTETPQDRDRRTVFVGNVDVSAMKTKPGASAFRRHVLQFCPSAKIESVRFRSIAFATPTAELPDESADTPQEEAEKKEAKRLEREKERARTWREEEKREREAGEAAMGKGRARAQREREEEKEEKEIGKDQKVFQLPGEKRKVAYIKKQFHAEVATVNAYVVFAHSPPNRSANVPPILDPYTAAAQLVASGHNSTFLGHTLRIDAVKRSIADIMADAKEEGKSTLPAKRAAWAAGKDVKASLFVGNLDFATKDEDLRAFFESAIVTERGEPPAGTTWVVDVRIIRDKDTQLGKGFGYVNFQDRESVDEVLALPADKLKFAKRNLRVQSCKTLPSALGGAPEKPLAAKDAAGNPAFRKPMVKPPPARKMPKGDPMLGEKIAGLSKDERKAVKSSDADRLARRAAKKDAAKVKAYAANSRDKVKLDVRGAAKKGAPKIKAKQGRVRSANALKKMKGRAD